MKEEVQIRQAVEAIKEAILQGQYEAAKGVNRIQLAVYFGIGKYISLHTRKDVWGTGALEDISNQLRRELPGLRGYSATNLKNMRLFYEAWQMLDVKSSVATDEKTASALVEMKEAENYAIVNSSVATDDLAAIDIYHTLQVPVTKDFPIEDFFKVPFTHHVEIYKQQDLFARYYYIHRTAEEHLSVDDLKKMIKNDAYGHREQMPSNFTKTISSAAMMRKAVMMFKDEYLLDFINVEEIGVRDNIDVDERVVEKEIVNKVKNFIMTIGRDFTFMGNQQLLEVRKPHENPSIGIVLCKSANREYVEFMIRDYSKPMGVATYKTADEMPENFRKALPDTEVFKKLLNESVKEEEV